MKELVKPVIIADASEIAQFYNECCSGDCSVNYSGGYSGGNCGTNSKSGTHNCSYNSKPDDETDILF